MNYKEKALEAVVYFNNYWKLNKLNTPSIIPNIITSRQDVAQIQTFLTSQHFNAGKIDGLWGEQTDSAYNMFIEKKKTGKIVNFRTDTTNNVTYLKTPYPKYKDIESFYGKLEDINKNIVTVTLPYKHILAWNTRQTVTKTSCHKKISDVYTTILEETLLTYGLDEIHKLGLDLFGGGFISPPRKMRGGSEVSTHSYGIAFDYNPENNQLKWGRDKAVFATPEYADWMDIWNKHGAINIGETKNYDFQHFQFSTF
jgi:hypothetical protein